MNQPWTSIKSTLKNNPRYFQGALGAGLGAAITAEYTRGRPNRGRKVLIGSAIGGVGLASLKENRAEKVLGWAEALFG